MEYNTPTSSFEKEKSTLIDLFENGDFEGARNLADKLKNSGCPRPIICKTLYNSFHRLSRISVEGAKIAAYAFQEYDFQCWLPEDERQ